MQERNLLGGNAGLIFLGEKERDEGGSVVPGQGSSAAPYLEMSRAEAESRIIMKEYLVFGQTYAWNLCPKVHIQLRMLLLPSVLC